jgi:hypothetical protein
LIFIKKEFPASDFSHQWAGKSKSQLIIHNSQLIPKLGREISDLLLHPFFGCTAAAIH